MCKGAPEVILSAPLVASVPSWVGPAAADLAADGLRVLAVAAARFPAGVRPSVEEPAGLDLLGLVGIGDPVRRQAADTARAFQEAGIRLALGSGRGGGSTTTSVASSTMDSRAAWPSCW